LSNITATHTVNVTFKIKTFNITGTAGPNGTISPSGTFSKDYGSSQLFTATPTGGYDVNIWTVDGNTVQTGGTTYTLSNITATHTVSVTFKIQTFNITGTAGPNGTINPSGTFSKDYGSSQLFTAMPSTGYDVNIWTVDGNTVQSGGTIYTLNNVTANHTVSVSFKRIVLTVTASSDANGTITPTGAVSVNYGDNQQFIAGANTGYTVEKWYLDDGEIQTGRTTYTLNNITTSHTVSVTFSNIILSISGYVVEQDGNTPVEGVLIQTDNNDVNCVTDANGYYELPVDYNWSGVVTPQKERYFFEPNKDTFTNVTQDYNDVNYTATLMTFKIAGFVLKTDYISPINDVNVSAENSGGSWTSRYGGGATLTDVNGRYEIVVDYNWSGKVTPTKYAYAFEPNSRYYADVNEDCIINQGYTGTLLTYRIVGHIKNECNVPIAGVPVSANDGGGQGTTDINGLYEVWVDYGWSGTVTPEKNHFTFEPNRMSYVEVLADQRDQNYTASNIYDLDCDGSIGYGDVDVISENWLNNTPGKICDFNADINVNFNDFAEFANIWAAEYGK
jgi:hypothetical protein